MRKQSVKQKLASDRRAEIIEHKHIHTVALFVSSNLTNIGLFYSISYGIYKTTTTTTTTVETPSSTTAAATTKEQHQTQQISRRRTISLLGVMNGLIHPCR